MAYREFKLTVPISDISGEDGDSPAIRTLFTILSVTPPRSSLEQIYDSFYDYSSAGYPGDPNARAGRGDVFIFASDSDESAFIAIDMFDEATDQMNTVAIQIRAPRSCADEVAKVLALVRSSAEVASALLRGDLGLHEDLVIARFPRLVPNHRTEVLQHAQVFREGNLIHSTRST